jgi:hypothetical protein
MNQPEEQWFLILIFSPYDMGVLMESNKQQD